MSAPRKPDGLDMLLMLAESMSSGDSEAAILRSEAQGQHELVNSQHVPAKRSEQLTELGFTLGELVEGDPLFRAVTLPKGWKREPSDHSMWSYIVDELGRRRVSMFYKAAFYDRDAFCRAETVYSYVSTCLYDDAQPILDDAWTTRDAVLGVLVTIEQEERNRAEQWSRHTEDYAREYEQDARAKIVKIETMRAALGGAS